MWCLGIKIYNIYIMVALDAYKNKIWSDFMELWKWSPGVIFSASHIMQLVKIYKKDRIEEVDPYTFLLFFIGNMGGFLFNRQYLSFKTWLAYISPSILEIYIINKF